MKNPFEQALDAVKGMGEPYRIDDYDFEAATLDDAVAYLIELCERHGEALRPVRIERGGQAWVAECYVSETGGAYLAANHPDNGDDAEYCCYVTAIR